MERIRRKNAQLFPYKSAVTSDHLSLYEQLVVSTLLASIKKHVLESLLFLHVCVCEREMCEHMADISVHLRSFSNLCVCVCIYVFVFTKVCVNARVSLPDWGDSTPRS